MTLIHRTIFREKKFNLFYCTCFELDFEYYYSIDLENSDVSVLNFYDYSKYRL